ncbi:MAG: hypothetical protein AAFU79_20155 [Myxococcota bacterium]
MRASLGMVAAVLASGCAGPAWQRAPHDVRFQRVPEPTLHPKPESRRPADWSYALEETTTRPLGRVLSPISWVDEATGGPAAHDVNAFGEVLDSTWFENRIGRGLLTEAEVIRGPPGPGPAPGRLIVLSSKISGASPGLRVRDREGREYLAKFDPPAYPGLASSAEVITTKILWSDGYHVPANFVRRFARNELVPAESAMGPGGHGPAAPMTKEGLDDLMMLANPSLGGRVQALFSRIVDGQPIGPFKYRGTRADDPNDTIPHERRRSLRAYRWFCAWTNNTDARASNSLDVYREAAPGRGYVVHYLLDFGNSLGSLGTKPKYQSDGYDPVLSWAVLGELFFTAGIRYRYWLPSQRSPYLSVGMFEADIFDPGRWTPSMPNSTFAASTPHDDFWAASLIARFTRPMVDGIVASANYRKPEAAQYVAEVLWRRRQKILRRAFARMAPIADLEVTGARVRFVDLEWGDGGRRSGEYVARWQDGDGDWGETSVHRRTEIEVPRLGGDSPFRSLEIRRRLDERLGPKVVLRLREVGDQLRPVALERSVL